MLTAKEPTRIIGSWTDADFSTQTSSSSGSSETEVTALAVIPCVCPSSSTATTVTPVVKRPITSRYARLSTATGPLRPLMARMVARLQSAASRCRCAHAAVSGTTEAGGRAV